MAGGSLADLNYGRRARRSCPRWSSTLRTYADRGASSASAFEPRPLVFDMLTILMSSTLRLLVVEEFMRTIRTTAGVFGIALFAAVMSGAGLPVAADAPIDQEVLIAREAAWRAFYDGDVTALREILPEEFIGINMNDGPFADRAKILDASRAFHERGGRLVRLAFPETLAQRFSDVTVIIRTTYVGLMCY